MTDGSGVCWLQPSQPENSTAKTGSGKIPENRSLRMSFPPSFGCVPLWESFSRFSAVPGSDRSPVVRASFGPGLSPLCLVRTWNRRRRSPAVTLDKMKTHTNNKTRQIDGFLLSVVSVVSYLLACFAAMIACSCSIVSDSASVTALSARAVSLSFSCCAIRYSFSARREAETTSISCSTVVG